MLSNVTYRRIEWGDCDPAGIVFNPNYFRWFDHATALLYEAAGWPKDAMLVHFGAAGCPVVETGATFRAPCRYGEDVAIQTSILEVRRSAFVIGHILTKGETICVEGKETRVWTIRDPASQALKSAPLPDELAARFREA
jgi:4-hydroxybenzoyl-CoA thioesterase